MRILLVEPGKTPVLKEIDGSLKSMQEIVGGTIQVLYPFAEPVALVCNDEGKLLGLPLNRALRDEKGRIYDIVMRGAFSKPSIRFIKFTYRCVAKAGSWKWEIRVTSEKRIPHMTPSELF